MASPLTYTVFLYNTTNTGFTFTVNQGNNVNVPATTSPNYAPVTPSTGNPQLVLSEFAGQGQFYLGNNQVTVNVPSGPGPQSFPVALSAQNVPVNVNSAQMYFFYKDVSTISWIFLINGFPTGVSGTFNAAAVSSPASGG